MHELKLTILKILAAAPGGIKSKELRTHHNLRGEDSDKISQKLFELNNKDGYIVRDESRTYTVTAKGLAAVGGKEAPATPASTAKNMKQIGDQLKKMGPSNIETILIDAEASAQGALDRYLSAVGDASIYEHLRNARDSAREALRNYREGQ